MHSLTLDELARAVQLTAKHVADKQDSMKDFLKASHAAGGVYPALFAYFLSAVAIGFFLGASRWLTRLVPAVVCATSFVHCLTGFESLELVGLFAFSAVVGACCTYVQVSSWHLALAHLDSKRRLKTS